MSKNVGLSESRTSIFGQLQCLQEVLICSSSPHATCLEARMYSRHCWQSNVRELLCHSGYIAMWQLGWTIWWLLDNMRFIFQISTTLLRSSMQHFAGCEPSGLLKSTVPAVRSSTDGFWACGYLWAANASVVVRIWVLPKLDKSGLEYLQLKPHLQKTT